MSEINQQGLPVTIITGFLGSGKSTLLNQILDNNLDQKVAVLANDFGDINIDAQLLVSYEDDMVELSNGCICCTINDSLVEAVKRILGRKEKVDRLIIEATGIADLLRIILTFFGSDFRNCTQLDSIITLIDTESFMDTEHSKHSHHLTTDGFVSMSFQSDKPFDVYKFHKFLNEGLPLEVFRAKGIIWFAGSQLRHIFQLYGQPNDIKSEPWSNSPANQPVFIGRHLDTNKLHQQLNNCLANSLTV
ncbi:MAG: GTP-binding protein [Crocosphaera sp.]